MKRGASYKERTRDQTRLGLGLGLGSLCPFFTGDPKRVQFVLNNPGHVITVNM